VHPVTSFGAWTVLIEGLQFGPPRRTAGHRRFRVVKANSLRCPEGYSEGQDRVKAASRSGAARVTRPGGRHRPPGLRIDQRSDGRWLLIRRIGHTRRWPFLPRPRTPPPSLARPHAGGGALVVQRDGSGSARV